MSQLMPLPLTVSCFSKIQIGFTFLVPAYLGSPGKRAVKWVCVCVCVRSIWTKNSKILDISKCWRVAEITHTHTRLTALFPGLPGWAGTRKVKPIWFFTEERHSEWQWHQLGHMQVCNSLQTDNHASTHHSVFYRPDALPAAQPTASKHCRQILVAEISKAI